MSRPSRLGRGLEIIFDDARFDDGPVRLKTTPGTTFAGRAGTQVLDACFTQIRDLAVRFGFAHNDLSQCATARACIQTGLYRDNHGLKDTNSGTYYTHARKGVYEGQAYGPNSVFKGPYEFDLALKYGMELLAANPADPVGLELTAQHPVLWTDTRLLALLSGGATRSGWDSDYGNYPVRSDSCTTTSGSRVVTDATVRAGDRGKLVTGTGIPASPPTYVGTVTPGSQFLLSSSPSAQVNVLATATGTVSLTIGGIGRGNTNDDLQQTGCRATWIRPDATLPHIDRLGCFGKNQNGTGSTGGTAPYNVSDPTGPLATAVTNRFVPPGYTDFACYTDDLQDHTNSPTLEYAGGKGSNYGSGDGAVGDNYDYRYHWPITAISWAAGVCTVTATNPNTNAAADIDVLLRVGDEIGVDYVATATGYNTNAAAVTTIVSQTPTAVTFKFAMAADPTAGGTLTPTNVTGTTTGAQIGVWKLFDCNVMAQKIINRLETIENTDTFFFQWGVREPHGSLAGDLPGEDLQAPMRYELAGFVNAAVDPNDYESWNGVAGAVSPASSGATSGRKQDWARRQHMLAAVDDAIRTVLNYMNARWGADGYWTICATDNGFMTGDHFDKESNAWSTINGKTAVWDACERVYLWFKHPDHLPQSVLFPAHVGDQALTVLDIFSAFPDFSDWANHHAHLKRDCRSLLRLLRDPADAGHQRLIWGSGQYYSSGPEDGQWIISADGLYKYIRSFTSANPVGLYDMTPDPASPAFASVDWETVDLSAARPATVAALDAALTTRSTGGWDVATQSNTMRAPL